MVKKIQDLTDDQVAAASNDELCAAYEELRAHHVEETRELYARVRGLATEREALRRQIEALLTSATPNEREHPMMFEQWQCAQRLLDGDPGSSVPVEELRIGPIYGDVPGWVRVGRYDAAGRRALWIYDVDPDALVLLPNRMTHAVVMRAGREGDDAYVELRRIDFPSDEKWLAFVDVVARALYAARDAKDKDQDDAKDGGGAP